MWCKMSMLFSRTEEAEKFWSILPPKQVEEKGDRVSCCFLSNFASRAVCIAFVAVSCNAESSL
jgi:hypothetical protein